MSAEQGKLKMLSLADMRRNAWCSELRWAVECLREDGRVEDDEGDFTETLAAILEWIESGAKPTAYREWVSKHGGEWVYHEADNMPAGNYSLHRQLEALYSTPSPRPDAPTSQIKEVPGNPGSVAGEGVGKL